MMLQELLKIHDDIPEAIIDSVEMKEANAVLEVYNGKYILKYCKGEIELTGKISFEWFPSMGLRFCGELKPDNAHNSLIFEHPETFNIFVEGSELGEGFLTNIQYKPNTETKIKGKIIQCAVLGDRSIAVSKIRFSVPNMREYFGISVKRVHENTISISKDRLILEDDKYTLTIDKCSDYKQRNESLEEKGGIIILYNGELIKKGSVLTHEDSQDLLSCLNAFLTFMNGSRIAALFGQGIDDEEVIWRDYTSYLVDSYKGVPTWSLNCPSSELNKLWKSFRLLWNDTDDKNVLTFLIHWYVEANGHSGFSEGSIIMAQTALELIYNWWIVEDKRMILGKDSENINASNKIRLLLSQLNLSSEVPASLKILAQFVETTDNVKDAPDAIVYIRNAIVHSQEEKRNKLSGIDKLAIYEALQVFLWYIELSLLCILDYNGDYINRCAERNYSVKEEGVPWKK